MRSLLICILLSTLAGVWGCRKDVDQFRVYDTSLADLQQLLSKVPASSTHTVFTFTGVIPDTFLTTASGLRVQLTDTENLFANAQGSTTPCSTCQTFTIEITEVLDKGDMLARGLSTLQFSSEKLVESVGMAQVRAFCNGQEMQLLSGRTIKVQIPGPTNLRPGLSVFHGNTGTDDQFLGWENSGQEVYWADWFDQNNNPVAGYEVVTEQLGWVSAGQELSEQTSSFCVSLPAGYTPENTQAFLVFDNLDAIVELKNDGDQTTFCYDDAPKGRPVRMIVISKHAGEFWLGDASTEIGTNATLLMYPQNATQDEILNLLSHL